MEGIHNFSGRVKSGLGGFKVNEPIDRSNMGSRGSTDSEINLIVDSRASIPNLKIDNWRGDLNIRSANLPADSSSTVPMEEDSKGLSEDNLDDPELVGIINDLALNCLRNDPSKESGRSSLPGLERDVIIKGRKSNKVVRLDELTPSNLQVQDFEFKKESDGKRQNNHESYSDGQVSNKK